MEAMIQTRALSRAYSSPAGRVEALKGIDLSVERGEFCAIIGHSGSGKSTLMNLLGCLDKPSGGEYLLDGVSVPSLSPRALTRLRRETVGFVFQGFHLIPRLTAEENVGLPLLYRGVPREEIRRRTAELLDRVGLAARAGHRPGELSGGQQQRVAIARAMVTRPKLLLADEPTGNLDPASTGEILSLLRECRADGATVLLITHDMGVAGVADRVLRMEDGRLV